MENLKKLVFEKINYKNLKMSQNNFADLVAKGAELGVEESQVKKLVLASLKNIKTFKETKLPLAILEERNIVFEADELHIPAAVLQEWREKSEAKLKTLQAILAANNSEQLQAFLAENPGLEAASKIPLSQFVKTLHKDIENPTQEFVPEPEPEPESTALQPSANPNPLIEPAETEKKGSSKLPLVLGILVAVVAIGAAIGYFVMNSGIKYGSAVDARDGHKYRTITLGTQEWMAENAAYATNGSVCYNDDNANCDKYGRLYTWYGAQNACPDGFHLPSLSEYETLIGYVNSIDTDRRGVGTLLKAKGPNEKETLGFVSIMTGNRSANGEYHNVGNYTRYWTTNRPDPGFSSVVKLDYDSIDVNVGKFVRENFYSVRCLKNYEGWSNYSRADYDETYDAIYYPKNLDMVKTVRIGDQIWTAQNVSDKTMSTGVYSVDRKGKKRKECGMFYTYSEAQKVCPDGWRLASKDDFVQLASVYGISAEMSGEEESGESTSMVFENLASALYAENGLNLQNCGMVVVENSSDMSRPEKCVKGFCSQQYGLYGGFWGSSFDVGISEKSVVLDNVGTESSYEGLLPVRCIYDGIPVASSGIASSNDDCGENCIDEVPEEDYGGGYESETSSFDSIEIPDEVYQGLEIAFAILLLVTFIMGACNSKVVFFNIWDFLLSLFAFVCFCGSRSVVNTEYAWAEIPLLVLGIVLFVRIILVCILDNRSILWGLLMSPLKICISMAVILYPVLWVMEKINKHDSFCPSSSDSRSWFEQKRDFENSKKFWSAILLALLALLIWICKKSLNGERVYHKNGWSKDDGWNYKMLFGKKESEDSL